VVDVAGAQIVAVLTRAPSRGGKSRLFAGLGIAPDAALLTALLLDTLDATTAAAGTVPELRRVVAVEPPDACGDVAALVGADVDVMPQAAGTLGDRMHALMHALFARGAHAVVIIGSDLPDLPAETIARAFTLLADRDTLVIGPATDGGYYLIGATRVPAVWDGMMWGTPSVLSQTLEAAAHDGLRVALLDPLSDVDTLADLRRVTAARTREWIRLSSLSR
jgi:rSAM/selenodomain-associated transferase 1